MSLGVIWLHREIWKKNLKTHTITMDHLTTSFSKHRDYKNVPIRGKKVWVA